MSTSSTSPSTQTPHIASGARRRAAGRLSFARLRGQNHEGVLLLTIIVLVAVIGILNPDFFAISTLFDVLRASMVHLVFALGVLIVIVSGGIDVSFPVIGIFAAYTTVVIVQNGGFDPGVVGVAIVALVIGVLLGLVNGGLIGQYGLPTLIVTLGTQGIFRGVLITYVGSKYIAELPQSMANLSTTDLVALNHDGATTRLHVFIVPVVLLCLLVAWMLRRTMFGRAVYAIGGDAESARRAGFPVRRTQLLIYVTAGALAAIGGMMHVILARNANPSDLAGIELEIIAAVVLGGASIMGGRGSVLGTVLGVLLISLISNSLILMGVPGAWQRTAVGALLIIGVSVQALSARRAARQKSLTNLEVVS